MNELTAVFVEHAAPEAIRVAIERAKRERSRINLKIEELYELLGRRESERAVGTWPAVDPK